MVRKRVLDAILDSFLVIMVKLDILVENRMTMMINIFLVIKLIQTQFVLINIRPV
jgi:hypothetical protein